MHTTEMELVRQAGNGVQAAWRELLRIHEPPLLAAVSHKVGMADAEDIVQETFVCLLRRIDAFDGRIPLSAYLMMLARRRCADWQRKQHRMRSVPLADNTVDRSESPETIAIRRETVAAVRVAIVDEVQRLHAKTKSPLKPVAVSDLLMGKPPIEVSRQYGCTGDQAAAWGFESRRQMRQSELLAELAAP